MTLTLRDLLGRDRLIVSSALGAICVLSWIYLFWMAADMATNPENCLLHMSARWTPDYFFMTFLMWAIMMIAMMVPSVSPMVLTFDTIYRKRAEQSSGRVSTWVFLAGYIAVWTAFSLAATLLQWGFHAASLLVAASISVGPILGGGLLVAAGVYQFTPWKNTCLAKCVSPLSFLLHEWREGKKGAFVMGLRHGTFCVGCCAMVMVLLFVAGVMNILWIAALGALVLIEKLAPGSRRVARAFGVLMIIAGMVLATSTARA